jgi:hypothetical protein
MPAAHHAMASAAANPLLVESETEAATRGWGVIGHVDHLMQEHERARYSRPAPSSIVNDWSKSMEATTSLIAAVALLILLAVTSIRFDTESREGFSTRERSQTSSESNSSV